MWGNFAVYYKLKYSLSFSLLLFIPLSLTLFMKDPLLALMSLIATPQFPHVMTPHIENPQLTGACTT